MARWTSKQSGWSSFTPSDGGLSPKVIAAGVAFVLLIGIGFGYLLASASSDGSAAPVQTVEGTSEEIVARAQSVVPTDLESVPDVDRSELGAVKAATSFLTASFNLSLLPDQQRAEQLDDLLSLDVTPDSRRDFETQLANTRRDLVGPPGNERPLTSKVLTLPGSYRVEDISADGSDPLSRVRVTVWLQIVQVDSAQQRALSLWTTNTLELTWADHWRINRFERLPGPTPEVLTEDTQFSTYTDVVAVFNQFNAYRYATQQ